MSNGLSKKVILLVDDDEIHLSITQNMLENHYDVLTTNSGSKAIEFFSRGIFPDLVLLDVMMPDMDGWETYNRIKGISLLKKIPIIFLTSMEDEAAKIHAFKLGVADYIKKPCTREDLLNSITRVLSL